VTGGNNQFLNKLTIEMITNSTVMLEEVKLLQSLFFDGATNNWTVMLLY
jgi:hypothetical protein